MDYFASHHGATDMEHSNSNSNSIAFPDRANSVLPHAPTIPVGVSVGCMPENYFATPDGVYFHDQSPNEDEGPVRSCSQIAVNGLCRRSDGKGWSRVVDIVDPDGQTHRLLPHEIAVHRFPCCFVAAAGRLWAANRNGCCGARAVG